MGIRINKAIGYGMKLLIGLNAAIFAVIFFKKVLALFFVFDNINDII